jgi:endonuclease/exonuclease/phosphatase family metal-dependent hydrolase
MKKLTRRGLIWTPIGLIGLIGLYFGVVVLVAYLSDYKPKIMEPIAVVPQKAEKDIDSSEHQFSLLSWNIGYCGLGKEQDFFYDGGRMVSPSAEDYQTYINGVFKFLSKISYVDFVYLQEIDLDSKRSFYNNQIETFVEALPNMSYTYALNYQVGYVPLPILQPMGKVKAGLMTWSRYIPYEASRIGFDVNFEWWKRIFMLDRCLVVTRHHLASGKDLVMINLHNSAFDDENKLKPAELNALKKLMIEEYNKGNFVVAGGDWNQNPPAFAPGTIHKEWNPTTLPHPIAANLFPADWKWAFDPNIPSNRFNDRSFEKGKNKTTIIDFFLVSPNVKVQSVETINLEFKYSDHQPILMTFDIAPEDSTIVEPL